MRYVSDSYQRYLWVTSPHCDANSSFLRGLQENGEERSLNTGVFGKRKSPGYRQWSHYALQKDFRARKDDPWTTMIILAFIIVIRIKKIIPQHLDSNPCICNIWIQILISFSQRKNTLDSPSNHTQGTNKLSNRIQLSSVGSPTTKALAEMAEESEDQLLRTYSEKHLVNSSFILAIKWQSMTQEILKQSCSWKQLTSS